MRILLLCHSRRLLKALNKKMLLPLPSREGVSLMFYWWWLMNFELHHFLFDFRFVRSVWPEAGRRKGLFSFCLPETEVQLRSLAEDGMTNGQVLSLNVPGARHSSPSCFLLLDFFHDSCLLGDDFRREAFQEGFVGLLGGCLGQWSFVAVAVAVARSGSHGR